MAGKEVPKQQFEIKDKDGRDILGSTCNLDMVKNECDEVQNLHAKLNAKLDELKSTRWLILPPELDKDAAPAVMKNLEDRLVQIRQAFIDKINKSEKTRALGDALSISTADNDLKEAYRELKAALDEIVTTLIDQWVNKAKNEPSESEAQRLARGATEAAKGIGRDAQIADATK
jgi:hypothetical protein